MKLLVLPVMFGVILAHVPLASEMVPHDTRSMRESAVSIEQAVKHNCAPLLPGVLIENSDSSSRAERVAVVSDLFGEYSVQREQSSIVRILTDRVLWGKDFAAALASLRDWKVIGESRVYVFRNQMVSTTPGKSVEETQRTAASLSSSLRARMPQIKPEFSSMIRRAQAPLRAEVLPVFEDDSAHVALTGRTLQFLAPRLSMTTVRNRLGEPEKVSRVTIQNKFERRGVVLTLYSYAGGAITFAEADYTAVHGLVDRVILDVAAVTAAVFQEGK